MKRIPFLLMLVLILVTTSASTMAENGSSSPDPKISVSIVGKAGPFTQNPSASANFLRTYESYLKPERQARLRGNPVTCNPVITNFVIQLEMIGLYTTKGYQKLLPVTVTEGGFVIQKHYDLIYAKNIIRECTLAQNSWDGLYLHFHLYNCPSNASTMLSIIAVNLGSDYDDIRLPGELQGNLTIGDQTISLPIQTGIHYFSLDYLQPYKGPNLSWLITGGDIDANRIDNPSGGNVSWNLWGGFIVQGNPSPLFLTGSSLDFSGKSNPSLVIYWDLSNTIEVYDSGTPGIRKDDIVTLRLVNPFPVSAEVVEESDATSPPAASNTSDAPKDVQFPIITGKFHNTIQWVYSNDPYFEKTIIIRKAWSAPTSTTDGEVVYEGSTPNYYDRTGFTGVHYYYRIFTVDTYGRHSNGIVLDSVQH